MGIWAVKCYYALPLCNSFHLHSFMCLPPPPTRLLLMFAEIITILVYDYWICKRLRSAAAATDALPFILLLWEGYIHPQATCNLYIVCTALRYALWLCSSIETLVDSGMWLPKGFRNYHSNEEVLNFPPPTFALKFNQSNFAGNQ